MFRKKGTFYFINLIISSVLLFVIFFSQYQQTLLFTYIISLSVIIFYLVVFTKIFSSTFFFLLFYIALFYIQPITFFITSTDYSFSTSTVKSMVLLTVIGIHIFIFGNIIVKLDYKV